MFEFENALKILILCAITGGMLLGAGFGIKALFFRRPALPPVDDERVAQLEARLAELEERVDFAERVLPRKP